MVAAGRSCSERGAVGLRVKDVAERAGLAPSSVLYYYPDVGDLLLDVARGAMERYAEQRAAAVREVEGAVPRLRLAIGLGIPTGPEDEGSRLLYEIDALTGDQPGLQGPQRRLLRPPGSPLRVADRGRRLRRRARAGGGPDHDRQGPRRDGGRAGPPGRPRPRRHRQGGRRRILLEYATAMVGADLEAVATKRRPRLVKSRIVREPSGQPDRYAGIPQYSLPQILAVWAAAAIPMGALSWVVAPWLSHRLGGREPLVRRC